MKSPAELSLKLAKQWGNASLREARMLLGENLPIRLPIGKPSSALVRDDISALRKHLNHWRNVSVGTVLTKRTTYRSLGQAIDLPTHWEISSLEDWVEATDSERVQKEFETLQMICRGTNKAFHAHFVKRRLCWVDQSPENVIKVAELVEVLEPNMANGAPLRTISRVGIDTKFIEQHRPLIIQLLDIRYQGKVSELGLENFLGAWNDNDQWVLVSDLNNHLLTFSQQRVRTSELCQLQNVSFSHLLIIENEKCLHQLPSMPSTLVILGCGLNLSWMREAWLRSWHVAYWGDLDTWGMVMLAKARVAVPALTPILMTREIFDEYAPSKSVQEPVPASDLAPDALTSDEQSLYTHLIHQKRGRLEQEFLPSEIIHEHFEEWMSLVSSEVPRLERGNVERR